MKKKKIKWVNILKLIIFLSCMGVILHDFYYVAFRFAMFTWYGLFTNIVCWIIAGAIYDDFEEQIKNIPSYRPKHAKDIK